jgi:hypothetical protein
MTLTVNYIYKLITLVSFANRPLFISCLALFYSLLPILHKKKCSKGLLHYLKLVLSVTYRDFIDNCNKFVLFFLLTVIYIYKLITLVTLANRPLFIRCLVFTVYCRAYTKKRWKGLLH